MALVLLLVSGQLKEDKKGGITEKTPSRSNYFDWINSEWPGSHQEKVMANLDFFEWMNHNYGMQLDIYHIDAGNIDRSPNWIPEAQSWEEGLAMAYGHIDDQRIREKFPEAFKPIVEKANGINTRMGIWLGPDGYGNTPEEAAKRRNMLVNFCKDYNMGLFKFDRACTDLSPENEDEFIKTMELCRQYTPDLIALNHRITLSEEAEKQMTTWLWEGKETYIDVHIWNEAPAPHHRGGALSRGLPPGLSRLTEDHGVCISSCLDYWEDDLILQAFNRNLILAPEIYGSPWLLRDEEFSTLARIYNLHKKYNDILVEGIVLPESYGIHAVSRGDDNTRLLTLRNLSWEPEKINIKLTKEIGINGNKKWLVKQLHPVEEVIGVFDSDQLAEVTVDPYRASLVLVTSAADDEFSFEGTPYRVIREQENQPVVVELLGYPGQIKKVKLHQGSYKFKKAGPDDTTAGKLLEGETIEVKFTGNPLRNEVHRKIADMKKIAVPADAKVLYEATAFAADNNALEVRSLKRSGPTQISQVQKARDQFFSDSTFWSKGIWDRYAFDGNPETSFRVRNYNLKDVEVKPGALRINFGKPVSMDKIVLKEAVDTFLVPVAYVSDDLVDWQEVKLTRSGKDITISLNKARPIQYVEIEKTPVSITEAEVYLNNKKVEPQDEWQISNLFPAASQMKADYCWTTRFSLDEISGNSYLCIAIPGNYGNEGAWAALKIDGKYIGAPDRSPSYESNHWEHVVKDVDGNYTYYFPLSQDLVNKNVEAFVLGMTGESHNVIPEVWITAYPHPYVSKKITLYQ